MTGVSKSTNSTIINEELIKNPTLEDYVKFSKIIRINGRNVKELLRANNLLDQLDKQNLTLSHVNQTTTLLKTYGDKSDDVLNHAETLLNLEARGKPYNQTVNDYLTMTTNIDKLRQENQKLEEQNQRLRTELTDLKDLNDLRARIKQTNYPVAQIHSLIKNQTELEDLGFTPETAKILAKALAQIGTTPEKAVTTLTNELHKNATLLYRNLELIDMGEAIERRNKALERKKEDLESDIQSLTPTNASLMNQIEVNLNTINSQNQQVISLEQRHKELNEEIKTLAETTDELDKKLTATIKQASENKLLIQIISILADPEHPTDLENLTEAVVKVNFNYLKHIKKYPNKTTDPTKINPLLNQALMYLSGEYKHAHQKKP